MAARRLVMLTTFLIVILMAFSFFTSTCSADSKVAMNCLWDNINIALVYDCRKNLIEQRDFFTELILAMENSRKTIHLWIRSKLHVSLMTYTSSGLVEVEKLTAISALSSRLSELFEPLANSSKEKCPDSLPFQDAIEGTGRALNDAGKKSKKFALFVLYENITSNSSDSEVVEFLNNIQSNDSEVEMLFIVITDNEELEEPDKFVIKSSRLEKSLIDNCLFRMCQWCGRDDRGYVFKNSCYNFKIFHVAQKMTAHESSNRCEEISPGYKMSSINSDEEMDFVYYYALWFLDERVAALDNYTFNFFIGLQGLIDEGVKRYSWSDGNPMVLTQFWEPSPARETCFYISSKKRSVNNGSLYERTWKETSCNEIIPVHLLLCEETMVASFDIIQHKSLRLNPELDTIYPFPESYLDSNWLNSDVTFSLLPSSPMKLGELRPRLENNTCELDERNSNEAVNDLLCHSYQPGPLQKNFRTSDPGTRVTFQMYISNQSGLNNYLTYTFVSGSTVKSRKETLAEDTHMYSDTSVASYFTNDTNESSNVFDQNRTWTCERQSDRLTIPKCVYETKISKRPIGCADNSHLQTCKSFRCQRSYVKCPNSYCIPKHSFKDGVKDCPQGEDEHIKKQAICSGHLTLALREICVARSLYESPGDHSGFLCQHRCDPGFACVSNVAGYSNSNKTTVFSKHIDFQIFKDSNTIFLTPQVYYFFPFYRVVQMNISGCGINSLNKTFTTFDIEEIISLDISNTPIRLGKLDLQNLRVLNAARHRKTDNINFPPFLEIIDLSDTKVSQNVILKMANLRCLRTLILRGIKLLNLGIEANSTLQVLDLRKSTLVGLKDGYLNWLSIQSALYTDDYRVCCEVIRGPGTPEKKCHSPVDAITTCHDLIGDPVKRAILWVVCAAALVGNLVVVMYKAVWDRAVLGKSYGVFVACLGCSDLIMGAYLLIIAGADIHYRSLYVLEDSNWREGNVCKIAGVLSTFSSQTSALFICLITLDRYLHVRYSFGEHKISKRGKIISISLVLFVGAAAAVVPVIIPRWKIYSSNALCLALPFRAKRHSGWQYSTVLFVGVNFVLFLLIAVGQLLIFRSLLSKRITTFASIKRSSRRLQESIAKQLALVALSNFCCWFPVCVIGIASVFGHQFDREMYAWSAVLILPINSAINPLIYTLPAIYKKIYMSCRV